MRSDAKRERPTLCRPSTLTLLGVLAFAANHCRSVPNRDGLAAGGPGRPIASTSPEVAPPSPLGSALPVLAEPLVALAAPGSAHRVLVIGDSLSDWRVGGGGYLRALQRACPNVTIDNRARGGWMVNQMRRRMETEITPAELARFTDLILFGGVNDVYSDQTAGRNFDKITRDLAIMYQMARSARLRIIAVTISPWGGFRRYYNASRAKTTHRINAWIEEQRLNGSVDAVIDAYTLLSCGDPERLCAAYAHPIGDGLHFGSKGHDVLGESLIRRAFPECASAK